MKKKLRRPRRNLMAPISKTNMTIELLTLSNISGDLCKRSQVGFDSNRIKKKKSTRIGSHHCQFFVENSSKVKRANYLFTDKIFKSISSRVFKRGVPSELLSLIPLKPI